jgi:hypothetical protein
MFVRDQPPRRQRAWFCEVPIRSAIYCNSTGLKRRAYLAKLAMPAECLCCVLELNAALPCVAPDDHKIIRDPLRAEMLDPNIAPVESLELVIKSDRRSHAGQ